MRVSVCFMSTDFDQRLTIKVVGLQLLTETVSYARDASAAKSNKTQKTEYWHCTVKVRRGSITESYHTNTRNVVTNVTGRYKVVIK